MISPWNLFKQSIRLFLKNFKYLLKFWIVNIGLASLGLLPLLIVFASFGFKYYKQLDTLPLPVMIPLSLVAVTAYIILTVWISAAGLIQAKSIMQSQTFSIKELLSQGWKIIGKLLVTGLLSGLAVMGGLILLIIPGIIFAYWFAFTNQIVAVENLSGTAALSRSKQLVIGRFWKTVWYMLFPILIVIAYSFITSAVAAAIPKPSRSVFELLFSIVTWPFGLVSLIYSFLVYREFVKPPQNSAPSL